MTTAVRSPRPTPRRAPGIDRSGPPQLRVVGPPGRRGRSVIGVVFVGFAVFVALFVAAVAHSSTVTAQVRLDRVSSQVRREQALLRREKLRLADYQSPVRIAREAEKLGMVPADQQRWISPGTGAEPLVVGADTPTVTSTAPPDPSADDASGGAPGSGSSSSTSGSSSSGSSGATAAVR